MCPIRVEGDDAIDLQLHTTYSDGSWRPAQLFDHLASAGFRVVAVTDHDHLGSVPEMVQLGTARGIHVIPAVEATTAWQGHLAHLLCFAEEFSGSALADLVLATESAQRENTRAVRRELVRRGYAFARQAAVLAAQGGEPERPIDNARLLLEHGHVTTLAEGVRQMREAGYRSMSADLAAAVAAAHQSNGVALLAHPGRAESGFTVYDDALLDALRGEIPLDGIEVRHPSHSARQVEAYDNYARRHGLLRSAGSDSHGPGQRLPIPYAAREASELLARCGVRVAEGSV
ncbi:MAG TPA: PHP domain-containing protein [Ktedonobacterales bacterium]|nr:PHP domain-containing protein [Ktedonobacterales bacterium]